MGQCYLKLNRFARASAAFSNAIRYEYPDSMQILYLAQALQSQGKYADAATYYKQFLERVPNHNVAQEGLRSCRMAPKWNQVNTRYTVKPANIFNSRRADFAPMYGNAQADIVYFSSTNDKSKGDMKSLVTGTKNSDVYVSKLDDKGRWSRPKPVEGELNTNFDEGITAFSPDGNTMYLVKATSKAEGPTSVEIYKSQRSEASWSAATKVEITSDTLSIYSDPAVSTDGNWLYFSSDMPGGQGGKDLWRINLKDSRGTLENLGDQVNTPGDERFPYWRNDSTLYFASNGHAGFGGLDLYVAHLQPSGKYFIENMGQPINSPDDDFGITFGKGDSGLFSSNRKDGRGFDHIYSFERPEVKVYIIGYVLDKDEEPVPNAIIRIVGNDGSNQKTVIKPDGSFRFPLNRGVSYAMLAGADGYLNKQEQFTADSTEEDAEYTVDFILSAMRKPNVIENIFYDFDRASLRKESVKALNEMVEILRQNPGVTIEMASHTDRVGTDTYNDGLSQRRAQSVVNYLIRAGIDSARLRPRGYGKHIPKIITKRLHRLYPQFAEGDTLTEAYIQQLDKPNQAVADQINRRTEFLVLTTDFKPFLEDREQYEAELQRRAEEQARRQAEALPKTAVEEPQPKPEQAEQSKPEQAPAAMPQTKPAPKPRNATPNPEGLGVDLMQQLDPEERNDRTLRRLQRQRQQRPDRQPNPAKTLQ